MAAGSSRRWLPFYFFLCKDTHIKKNLIIINYYLLIPGRAGSTLRISTSYGAGCTGAYIVLVLFFSFLILFFLTYFVRMNDYFVRLDKTLKN